MSVQRSFPGTGCTSTKGKQKLENHISFKGERGCVLYKGSEGEENILMHVNLSTLENFYVDLILERKEGAERLLKSKMGHKKNGKRGSKYVRKQVHTRKVNSVSVSLINLAFVYVGTYREPCRISIVISITISLTPRFPSSLLPLPTCIYSYFTCTSRNSPKKITEPKKTKTRKLDHESTPPDPVCVAP